jgi:hypothetical protein
MPTRTARSWGGALADHEAAVAEMRAVVSGIPADRWHVAVSEGKWSPAEEVLHVTIGYEFARANIGGGPGMRLRVSALRAALLRWFLLPRILRTGRFPREVRAPREVRPPSEEASGLDAGTLMARLTRAAESAAAELAAAAARAPSVRMAHAYFGPLRPLVALRLLAAHTRHHARRLARARGVRGAAP